MQKLDSWRFLTANIGQSCIFSFYLSEKHIILEARLKFEALLKAILVFAVC